MSRFPDIDRLPITAKTRMYLRYGDVSGEYRGAKNLTRAIATGCAARGVPLDTVRLALSDPSNVGGEWSRSMQSKGKAAMVDAVVTESYRFGRGWS